MAGIDSTNSQAFAKGIIDAVLETLQRQSDTKKVVRIDGVVNLNPQTFRVTAATSTLSGDAITMTKAARQQYFQNRGQDKRHYVIGPIMFTNIFSAPPNITFGQSIQPVSGDQSTPGPADNNVPFLVQPYLHSWHNTGGQVDGFFLGLYALTAPTQGTTQHLIHWSVNGVGSKYSGRAQEDSWTKSYDNLRPSFLTDTSK